ncbi:SGNH/GDSL hydrolase family protein [Nocardioides speluncae]|uniref:SGNH/GDSL hydrolase family protein n=1 Tax=Nocardioides speluncae TaxID=2670337 RepID=UPI0012B167E0|nr:SGNH/GDSL hydrolase family protein [Nocardioides speluncae]
MPTPRLLISAAAAATAVAALVVSPATAQAADPLDYVALGDSAAAGPLIPNQNPNLPCLRSTNNWANVTARALGARLTDVSCSGATTGDMAGRQFGYNAPQYDALKPDTDLVTITIGANDLSLGTFVPGCWRTPPPFGISCKSVAYAAAGGKDPFIAKIATMRSSVATVLDTIETKSPDAEVIVVGYGKYYRKGGCYWTDPVWPEDADYIQSVFTRLNETLRDLAAERGLDYVDSEALFAGHDICAPASQRWMEGLVPTTIAAPYHANRAGHDGTAAALLGLVG